MEFVPSSRSKVNLLPTTVGCINDSAQNQLPCSSVGIAVHYVYAKRNQVNQCARFVLLLSYIILHKLCSLVLTSSISGRSACLSEEVTFTCTAQTTAVFGENGAFGAITMHCKSPRSVEEFRAEIVSYGRPEFSCNCLTQWNHSYMQK